MNRTLIPFFLLLCIVTTTTATTLPEAVTTTLKRARIPMSNVGIFVQEVGSATPLIAVNAEQGMNPASTMKLLTSIAALDILGPAYRWKTEAYLDGKLDGGVLQGNLVFKGRGDPKLTVEQFWMWLRELRQRGLREIRGDIVLDHNFFEDAKQDAAEFDNDPSRAYNVGTNALLLNFNAIHLHLIPNGRETTAMLEPTLASYTVQNNITTSTKLRCHGADSYKVRLDGHIIKLEGHIPANCGEADSYLSLLPHDEYFFAVFSALWQELGGTVQGKLRTGTAPMDQPPYASYVSPELSEMIRDMNKFSNNSMARQIFLTLGTADTAKMAAYALPTTGSDGHAELPGEQGDISSSPEGDVTVLENPAPPPVPAEAQPKASIPRSIEHMQQWLNTQHLKFPELVLENGSGLSRNERISAQHLAEILQRAARSPFSAELESSLPILGMDGTVKKRFRDSELAGHAHLKTGTLDGVKSMAGYVDARSGKKWVVVFMINGPHAAKGLAAQDMLIEWVQSQH